VHRNGNVVPLRCHEVVAEAHLGRKPDAVQDAVDPSPLVCQGGANVVEVLGNRDVELVHVNRGGQLAPRPLCEAECSSGASEDDVGSLALGQLGDAEGERGVGEDAGNHDVLSFEETHAGHRSHGLDRPIGKGGGRRRRDRATVDQHSRCARLNLMRIGILGGTGPAGSALAARLASIGYEVVIGSRSKYRAMEARDSLAEKWPDLADRLAYGDNAGASSCDLIVIATPWDSAATTAQENEEALAGKVVISMANALIRVGHEFQPLVPPRGSVAAHVQAAVPRCRVVAAFHHLPATELGHLGEPIDSDVLICGDDSAAVRTVSEIVRLIPGCRPLDAGELSNATAIEAFTAVLLQLNVRYKTRVAPKLTGIKRDPREGKA
jgi:8-hydroxy-5-deazaflavin:NADPH oxidoreductase